MSTPLKSTTYAPASCPQPMSVSVMSGKSDWTQQRGEIQPVVVCVYDPGASGRSLSDTHFLLLTTVFSTVNIPKLTSVPVTTLRVTECRCSKYQSRPH